MVGNEIKRYGSAAVIGAARISHKTLNNWLSRTPAVVLLSDDERREAGERKRFSFDENRIVQIALTAELVALGVQPRRAAISASVFTDTNSGVGLDGMPERRTHPGALHDAPYTLLVVPPEPGYAKVMAGHPRKTTLIGIFDPEFKSQFDSAIIIRIERVVYRIRHYLQTLQGV